MDGSLVAWGRAVKARRAGGRSDEVGRRRAPLPPLWLFTDPVRTPDLLAAVRALPRGLCGVVFRSDRPPGSLLLHKLARLCRQRRLALVVAGSFSDLPAGVGQHLRRGRGCARRSTPITTSSAHDGAELVRARRAGADLVFVSPAFPTASHPGGPVLGPVRWGLLTRRSGVPASALGGIAGGNARRLPAWVAGAGAIGALLP